MRIRLIKEFDKTLKIKSSEIKNIRVWLKDHYGITLCLRKINNLAGSIDCKQRKLTINKKHLFNKHIFYSTLCHELYHQIATDNKKYATYHNLERFSKRATKQCWKLVCRDAWKAERWVDTQGERLCSFLFPHIVYKKCYKNDTYTKNWLKVYYKEYRDWSNS